ncbi:hypothetical protein HYH03_006130 [Edaphochlamys debaryana]|uniref:Apple domain-containing protein n=1 Tax=Edaphochlamys debaryana TaxID=47281 RepID=A0A835Y6B2_9CHLO|nr:hypothetical protein HYH03_006130 [Edaphochlamys debaryana]|eukprot:KAG2495892.1 hypothetical protein HYH03_006130 [Edaphochlamys debaryana]
MARLVVAACLLLAAASCVWATKTLNIDFHKEEGTAVASETPRVERFLQSEEDTVCYEGCFDSPEEFTDPYPTFLIGTVGFMPAQDCYDAALAAGFSFFAIVDETDCFGGDSVPVGWAPDVCPLECGPGGGGPCGAKGKAAVFSMGACQYLGAPCAPEVSPQEMVPLSPPSQPSPVIASPPPSNGPVPPPPPPPDNPVDGPPPGEPDFPPPESPSSDAPPPPAIPSSPEVPSPPPPVPEVPPIYVCRPGVSLWGVFLPKSPVKLNPTHTEAANLAKCEELCSSNPDCAGYYYKKTQWCYLMLEVWAFGKEYPTAISACRKM